MHALLILDVVLQVSGTRHQGIMRQSDGIIKDGYSRRSLELYEEHALRIHVPATLKNSGLLPDMASEVDLLQSSRADVCFGELLHTIACGSADH